MAKRYLLQVAARNLGLIMRKLFGMGTPRGLQPEGDALLFVYLPHIIFTTLRAALSRVWDAMKKISAPAHALHHEPQQFTHAARKRRFSTGC